MNNLMTHQQKLDFIRQACNKANHALMELGFGCRLILTGLQTGDEKHFVIGTTVAGDILTHKEGGRIEEPVIRSKNLIKENEYWTILGRLPSLADILLAIGEKQRMTRILVEFEIDGIDFRISCDLENTEDSYPKGVYWNLFLPFDQQDEICIDFLFELLK